MIGTRDMKCQSLADENRKEACVAIFNQCSDKQVDEIVKKYDVVMLPVKESGGMREDDDG